MGRNTSLLGAAFVGLALASPAFAQTTGSGSTTSGTTGSSGGVVNERPQPFGTSSGGSSGLVTMKDLLNFKIQAQDGSFGRVSDVVLDRNGNLQYVLGSYQGQTVSLPLMLSAFNGAPNTLTYNVPIETLQQLAINTQNLPTLQNQAFVQRMQQVFGSSFGANTHLSAYPPTNTQTGAGTTGTGTKTGTTGTTSGTTGAAGSGKAGTRTTGSRNLNTGTPGRAGANNDSWNWPTNPGGNVPGTGAGKFATPPGTPRDNATGSGSGTQPTQKGGRGTAGAGTGSGSTSGSTSGSSGAGSTSGSGSSSGSTGGSGS